MTPQHLSIADLKAVIKYIDDLNITSDGLRKLYVDCSTELSIRVLSMIPPTEPKTEEK